VDWVKHKKSCPLVVVREVEVKGKGLVAIRNISAGTVIITEDPLIIVNKKDEQDVGFEVPGYEQFKKMDPVKKHELMELYDPKEKKNNFDRHEDLEYAKFCRIVAGNYVSINNKDHPGDKDVAGVFKQLSRINHSCSPNSFAEWEAGSVTHSVRAARMIKKGEEVTSSYLGSKDGAREDRRKDLLDTWHFHCGCEVCSLTGEEREVNDSVRMMVVTHLMRAGREDNLIRMMKDKKNISSTLRSYLKVLAESYRIEEDRGKRAVMLSICHVLYRQVERLGGGWVWPTDNDSVMVRMILQKNLGENFLEELDVLAISAASVLTRYFKANVKWNLGLLS